MFGTSTKYGIIYYGLFNSNKIITITKKTNYFPFWEDFDFVLHLQRQKKHKTNRLLTYCPNNYALFTAFEIKFKSQLYNVNLHMVLHDPKNENSQFIF
jgi:hypothetical protein